MSGDRTSGSGHGRAVPPRRRRPRSAALAGRAPGGAPAVDHLRRSVVAAAVAGLARPAVAVEVVLVAARAAVDGPVVAQRRAAVVDALRRAPRGSRACSRAACGRVTRRAGGVDAGPPQRLVGVDVADAGDGRWLSSWVFTRGAAAPQGPPEHLGRERLGRTARARARRASAASRDGPRRTTATRPNRRTSRSSRTSPSSSAHHARTYGIVDRARRARSRSWPVMPRWTTSSRPSSSSMSRYLPRRPTRSTVAPAASAAAANLADGCPPASTTVRPVDEGCERRGARSRPRAARAPRRRYRRLAAPRQPIPGRRPSPPTSAPPTRPAPSVIALPPASSRSPTYAGPSSTRRRPVPARLPSGVGHALQQRTEARRDRDDRHAGRARLQHELEEAADPLAARRRVGARPSAAARGPSNGRAARSMPTAPRRPSRCS